MDEPALAGMRDVQQQAAAAHSCFPGAKVLVTGNPTQQNGFVWDNQGNDDVDIWTVLGSRFYGKFTVPAQTKKGADRSRQNYSLIQQLRGRGKMVWAYNYRGTKVPDYTTAEPLSDSRLFALWAALEGVRGVLYGQGTTNYTGNPFASVAQDGAFVLLYPGPTSSYPSARLEQ